MPLQTPEEAIRYAWEKQIDLKAAQRRTDIRASDAQKEARNKRDWALRRLTDMVPAYKAELESEDGIIAFLKARHGGELV